MVGGSHIAILKDGRIYNLSKSAFLGTEHGIADFTQAAVEVESTMRSICQTLVGVRAAPAGRTGLGEDSPYVLTATRISVASDQMDRSLYQWTDRSMRSRFDGLTHDAGHLVLYRRHRGHHGRVLAWKFIPSNPPNPGIPRRLLYRELPDASELLEPFGTRHSPDGVAYTLRRADTAAGSVWLDSRGYLHVRPTSGPEFSLALGEKDATLWISGDPPGAMRHPGNFTPEEFARRYQRTVAAFVSRLASGSSA